MVGLSSPGAPFNDCFWLFGQWGTPFSFLDKHPRTINNVILLDFICTKVIISCSYGGTILGRVRGFGQVHLARGWVICDNNLLRFIWAKNNFYVHIFHDGNRLNDASHNLTWIFFQTPKRMEQVPFSNPAQRKYERIYVYCSQKCSHQYSSCFPKGSLL